MAFISDQYAVGSLSPAHVRDTWESRSVFEQFVSKSRSSYSFDAFAEDDRLVCSFCTSSAVLDEVSTILTSTSWGDIDVTTARQMRATICDILQVDINSVTQGPATRTLSSGKSSKSEKKIDKDELDSYSALVRDVGY